MFFDNIPFSTEEILFDPQTSGGLIFSVSADEADSLLEELKKINLPASIVGEIIEKTDVAIKVVK